MIEFLPIIVLVAHMAGHSSHDVMVKGLPFRPSIEECVEVGRAITKVWKEADPTIDFVTFVCEDYQWDTDRDLPPEGHPPVEAPPRVPAEDEA